MKYILFASLLTTSTIFTTNQKMQIQSNDIFRVAQNRNYYSFIIHWLLNEGCKGDFVSLRAAAAICVKINNPEFLFTNDVARRLQEAGLATVHGNIAPAVLEAFRYKKIQLHPELLFGKF